MADKQPVKLAAAFGMQPERAIEYFRAKGYAFSWSWQDLWQEAQAKAFTVAKVMRADVLEDIREHVDRAVANGTTLQEFKRNLGGRLAAKGWMGSDWVIDEVSGEIQGKQLTPRRLKTIYQSNTQSAYMAGRYRSMLESVDSHPYWQYIAVLDAHTRPAHRALNGKVFRHDDPIWQTIYPPNGFNCRCRVVPLTAAAVKAMGLVVESSAGRITEKGIMVGGEIQKVPALRIDVPGARPILFAPDAGWGYSAGSAAFGNDVALLRKISQVQDRGIRVQAVQAINNSELRHQAFAGWVGRALARRRAGHEAQVLGFVDEDIADFARLQSGEDPARVLVLPEKRLLHADSQKHHIGGIALSLAEYQRLPEIVANPDAVYWDKLYGSLAYVADDGAGGLIYVPVEAMRKVKRLGQLDILVNAYRLDASANGAGRLKDASRFVKMERGL